MWRCRTPKWRSWSGSMRMRVAGNCEGRVRRARRGRSRPLHAAGFKVESCTQINPRVAGLMDRFISDISKRRFMAIAEPKFAPRGQPQFCQNSCDRVTAAFAVFPFVGFGGSRRDVHRGNAQIASLLARPRGFWHTFFNKMYCQTNSGKFGRAICAARQLGATV